ncbi:MAG TPA: hypothetical protein VF791_05335 [Pyrinomonadaceae bacterium]
MRKVYKLFGAGLLIALASAGALAQGPRTADTTQTASVSMPKPAPAPQTFKAKYEGGIFGFNQKQTGTLSFDDANQRLVFRNKGQQEYISIPYAAVVGAFADTKSQTTTGGKVVSALPLPYGANLLGLLSRKKLRYLVLQFSDADTRMSGLTSFKLEDKDLLASVLHTLAEKARLDPRGDGFIRKKAMNGPEM